MASSYDFCELLKLTQDDIKNKQDSLSRPPKTLPTECDPYFCDSRHAIHHSPQELEDYLLSELKSSVLMRQVTAFAISKPGPFLESIKMLIKKMSMPEIYSSQNEMAANSFRNKMTQLAASTFNRQDKDNLHFFFSAYMLTLVHSEIPCFRAINIDNLPKGLLLVSSNPSERLCSLTHCQHEQFMRQKGWNVRNIIACNGFIYDVVASPPTSLISRWFDFIFNFIIPSLSATRFIDYARMSRSLSDLKLSGTIPPEKLMIAGTYNEAMKPWVEGAVESHYPHHFDAEEIKQEAEKFWKSKKGMNGAVMELTQKNLLAAIACYGEINFLALGPQPLLLQSLLNSTALRFKCAEAQPLQLPFAIFDASRALDIDPNNTKALLRRGIGLARVKKWDEAIIDFERAVELDPNLLAKKELEVARREVTRRTGG